MWRGGHGQLWGQGDERAHVDHAGVGRRPQQRQVPLTRCQEGTKSLDDRKQDSDGDYLMRDKMLPCTRWSTWVLAWDFFVLLFHSIGINRSGWSICWQSQESVTLTTWKVWTAISKRTSLDVFFRYPAGHFFGVLAHPEAEERKRGIVAHQHSESGVEIGAIPLARYGPAPQLETQREKRLQQGQEEICPWHKRGNPGHRTAPPMQRDGG